MNPEAATVWLIVVTTVLTFLDKATSNLTVSPEKTVTILNGSDMTINCTLSESLLPQQNASNIAWHTCLFGDYDYETAAIAEEHTVEILDDRTSSLHLKNMMMRDFMYIYQCSLGDAVGMPCGDYYAELYVALLPGPVTNLQCSSYNMDNFTCTWDTGRDTTIRLQNVYFQYKSNLGSGEWDTTILDGEAREVTKPALNFGMKIRVIQENVLGNCTTHGSTDFNALDQTVPKKVNEVTVNFRVGENDTIAMVTSWGIPDGWSRRPLIEKLLDYRIMYGVESSNKSTTVNIEQFSNDMSHHARSYIAENVHAYSEYYVKVSSKVNAANKWSEWSSLSIKRSPEIAPSGPVVNLRSSMTRKRDPYKRDVQVSWQPPSPEKRNGLIRGYHIKSPQIGITSVSNTVYMISDLDKFHVYDIQVAAYTLEGAVGPYISLTIQDLTLLPDPVENFHSTNKMMPTAIQMVWDEPSDPKGVVKEYFIEWEELNDLNNKNNKKLHGLITNFTITDLQPYKEYEVRISVKNKAGSSTAVTKHVRTYFSEPTQPRYLEMGHKSSPSKIELKWEEPERLNGPFLSYEVRYRLSTEPTWNTINKSVSEPSVALTLNCSAFDEAVPFIFEVFTTTGTSETKMNGPSAKMERNMCGAEFPLTTIIIIILLVAFCAVLLPLCLYYSVHNSPLSKHIPDPVFIDGILEPSNDKFKPNPRLATRRQEKEDYDALRTCESTHELIGQGPGVVSMSSSSGSSSDQGFHDMNGDDNYGLEVVRSVPNTRCSSGYGRSVLSHSESDPQQQTMLSMNEENAEEDSVFGHPDEDEDCRTPTQIVETYSPSEIPPSVPLQTRVASRESVLYTSRRESPIVTRRSPHSSSLSTPEHRHSSGSQSGYMNYAQLGADLQQIPAASLRRHDAGEESDTSYSQMAIQRPMLSSEPPPYASVWPSAKSPEQIDLTAVDMKEEWLDGLHGDLGFNNNSKEIPDIHSSDGFRPQSGDIIVATAFSPQHPVEVPKTAVRSSPPRLSSSSSSEDYIGVVGGNISPRANLSTPASPTMVMSPLTLPCSNGDISCQDYVLQCQLLPASPVETSIL